jgi:predicted transcriptional regulator
MKIKKTQIQILKRLVESKRPFTNKMFIALCKNPKAKVSRRLKELGMKVTSVYKDGTKRYKGV